MKNLKKQFNEISLMKIFEIEVLNKNGETDHIIFDISLKKNSLIAQHEALTRREERSKKIAFKKLALDNSFSLDEHLQELHEICTEAIMESDFFKLNR